MPDRRGIPLSAIESLREEGMTYAEIAQSVGCSMQNIAQRLGRPDPNMFRQISAKQCVYPGLRKWMNDNRVSLSQLHRKMYGTPKADAGFRQKLRGKGYLNYPQINKLLEVTGHSYEFLFLWQEEESCTEYL